MRGRTASNEQALRESMESMEDWAADALCIDADPNLYFPEEHTSQVDATLLRCRTECLVRTECLMHAIKAREIHGIWGGYGQRARARIAKDIATGLTLDVARQRERRREQAKKNGQGRGLKARDEFAA